jgi:pyruvate dehydrogenase E2 component (dihydrolipoamide acetyltransferase)
MAHEIKLPALGENVGGGDVLAVKVAVGDEVKEGQALVEVEAEKSTVDVPSPQAGRIAQILVKKGDKVKTGQTLMVMEGNGKPTVPVPTGNAGAKPATPAAPPAPAAPAKVEAKPVETKTPVAAAKKSDPGPSLPTPPAAEEGVVPAGPATRRLAREWGVNLGHVPGSGVRGRVSPDDVKGYVRGLASGAFGPGLMAAPTLPDFSRWGPVEPQPFESIRKKTAERLSFAWSAIPHVTHHDQADVSEIENFRKQQADKGQKLTVTAFVLKACAIVLKQYPQFNSSLDLAQGQMIFKNYYNLGVAVDTERGLVVPVLREVDKKSVHDLGREMGDIADKARQRKLTADDMQGGTFTISNLGGIGGTGFSPIVNWPEVAILGLSRSRMEPVYKDGQFVPRLLLPLSLSYDHRVIDGADAARFARALAELLENPMMMLLHA